MPINTSLIKFYESTKTGSGGVKSIGGVPDFTSEVSSSINAFFDAITASESSSGYTDYRCFYVRNEDASYDLISGAINLQGVSTDEDTFIGIAILDKNTDAQELSIETAVPTGVTFVEEPDQTAQNFNADLIGGADDYVAVWVRRRVVSGIGALSDSCAFRVTGETAP